MNEPASKEDLEKVLQRLDDVEKSVEGMRSQNSAEHGSLFTKMTHITELMHWLRAKWERFMGPPAPTIPTPPAPPRKDDTQ
jgi:hypothetical protein